MIARALLLLTVLGLAACDDPIDQQPRGQAIPTTPALETSYAPGSGRQTLPRP